MCVCMYIWNYERKYIAHMHIGYMVGAGNFGRKLQAAISDVPYKYMY